MITPDFNLTAAQARFAEENQAVAVTEGDGGSIFFYRRDECWVHRWIVGASGRVLDEAQFRHHPPERAAVSEPAPVPRVSDNRLPV